MAERRPFIQDSPDVSDTAHSTPGLPSQGFAHSSQSFGTQHIAPPQSPPASRPGFSRLQSDSVAIERTTPETIHEEDEGSVTHSVRRQSESGLGILAQGEQPAQIGTGRRVSIQAIPRQSYAPGGRGSVYQSPSVMSPPGSANPFADNFVRDSSNENTPDLRRERFSPGGSDVGTFEDFRRGILKNGRQSNPGVNDYQQYLHSSDTERLRGEGGASSIRSAYENDFRPTQECPTARDFYQSRFTWLNVSFIIICLFSCVFSGIFLGIAIREPFWGKQITTHGPLKPADAVLLTAVFAKLIELSFVTSFVAFLGQVLSRRAFMKDAGRGVTLSELSMWRWIVQPGTLITHPIAARYAGLSPLGIASLVSAILATLYTSASTALVQPVLKEGSWKKQLMMGSVKTDFVNINYIKALCKSPIRADKEFGGTTCTQIEHAGQGYFNYEKYLSFWDLTASNGNGTKNQTERPPGFGLLYDNTTVTAQWIQIINTTEVSKKYGRAVNNVTLALPHSGVFSAAHDARNNILQPEDLNSEGSYTLRASVPSPVLNVLCANMNRTELIPIVYDAWNTGHAVNISSWTPEGLMQNATTRAHTVVDDLFGWNAQDRIYYPPVFGKYPMPFNTIMNHTSYPWGRPFIYLLGQGGADDGSNMTDVFSLCRMHVALSPDCSTRYTAMSGGGSMEALCEDKADDMQYSKLNPGAQWKVMMPNWRDVGTDWANAMSLNTGIMDANASNSRLLMQLMLKPTNPDPKNFEVDISRDLPSQGEALAVMAGCTLLQAMLDAPFVMDWNYSRASLDIFQTQYFQASLKAQQFASGGVDDVSRAWIPVLALVFIMNIGVIIYFFIHRGLVTDFSEPPNLFALAVNSPPSHVLAGSCGGGPEGKQYMVNWFVNHEGNHLFMEPSEKSSLLAHSHSHVHGPVEEYFKAPKESILSRIGAAIRHTFGMKNAPKKTRSATAVESLRPVQSRPVSMMGSEYEMHEGYERTRKQYTKLAQRRSML